MLKGLGQGAWTAFRISNILVICQVSFFLLVVIFRLATEHMTVPLRAYRQAETAKHLISGLMESVWIPATTVTMGIMLLTAMLGLILDSLSKD